MKNIRDLCTLNKSKPGTGSVASTKINNVKYERKYSVSIKIKVIPLL